MRQRLLIAAAPLLLSPILPAQSAPVAPVTEAAMRRHIDILASDAFEGRKPGTAGETKTLGYLVGQFAALGLEPAGEGGTWYQKVPLIHRSAFAHRALFSANAKPVAFAQDDIVLIGRDPVERLADAPVWLAGEAAPAPNAELNGAVVLLPQTPAVGRDYDKLVAAYAKAGAAAVIILLGPEVPWETIGTAFRRGRDRLHRPEAEPRIQGIMPRSAALALVDDQQLAAAAQPGFRPSRLSLRASLDVSTQVRAYTSHNVIGRLKGRGRTGENILYLGHWDHLGVCRPEGAADRICNGAVDNASGLAMMIEIARALSRGVRPERDLLFMGTTAEESGLLGAEWFGAQPTVPLKSLVAAINIDTVAIAPAGEAVAIVGRGTTPLDPIIDATARELGRAVDADEEANAFIQRQDGYVLTRAGVPTVMVGGSFSTMGKLGAFLSGPYHKPEDDLSRPIELGGAVEDTNLLIALGRKLADPKLYPTPAR
jgi:hypothetical protein